MTIARNPSWRVVIDTNTVLRGLVGEGSASALVLEAAESRAFVPLLSKPVLDEYRETLLDPELRESLPRLTPQRVEIALRRLRFVGDIIATSRTHFVLPRDPDDAKFIELAIAGEATHLVTFDRDLLSLRASRSEAAQRLRQRSPELSILDAPSFLRELRPK
jgi:putative PIN family toxin of toxin-antitoxin system